MQSVPDARTGGFRAYFERDRLQAHLAWEGAREGGILGGRGKVPGADSVQQNPLPLRQWDRAANANRTRV
jgi:hypothetical protein